MLVKKNYLILLGFFFLQDVIELIVWFSVGYFFGHVFFYVIRAEKKNPRKDITDFFEKYKQKMAEKPSLVDEFQSLKLDEVEKPSSVEEKKEPTQENNFLLSWIKK